MTCTRQLDPCVMVAAWWVPTRDQHVWILLSGIREVYALSRVIVL